MCDLAWHNCAECGEEYPCKQPNSDCQVLQGYGPDTCGHCLFWQDEFERDIEREQQRKDAAQRWLEENGFDY